MEIRNLQVRTRLVISTWWRHQMKTFSALPTLYEGNSPVTGEFPSQRPVTRSFDAFFDQLLNKRLSKHSWGWWFETPLHSLSRHCNVTPENPLPLLPTSYFHPVRPESNPLHVCLLKVRTYAPVVAVPSRRRQGLVTRVTTLSLPSDIQKDLGWPQGQT